VAESAVDPGEGWGWGTALLVTGGTAGAVALTAAGIGGPAYKGSPELAWFGALALGIQWLAWVPAALARSERFYDLTGSLTYLALLGLALGRAAGRDALGPRGLLVAAAVAVWALRLGSYLFLRVLREGQDGRFDEIKQSPPRFWIAWTLQGLWVFWTLLVALVVLLQDSGAPLGPWDALGLGVWSLGFSLEVVADRQKAAFRADPGNAGRWIDTGLWAYSRHPNYLGEIILWTGIALLGSGIFRGGQWLAWISPVFVALLLTKGSGIPLLEARADERWGNDPAYQAYKDRVPVLVPGF